MEWTLLRWTAGTLLITGLWVTGRWLTRTKGTTRTAHDVATDESSSCATMSASRCQINGVVYDAVYEVTIKQVGAESQRLGQMRWADHEAPFIIVEGDCGTLQCGTGDVQIRGNAGPVHCDTGNISVEGSITGAATTRVGNIKVTGGIGGSASTNIGNVVYCRRNK